MAVPRAAAWHRQSPAVAFAMLAQRIVRRFHRIAIALAVICAVLALLNLFNSDPGSARNAAQLLGIGVGAYIVAFGVGVVFARLLRDKPTPLEMG